METNEISVMGKNKNLYDRSYNASAIMAAIYLFSAFVINYFAGSYATNNASNSVTDILLNILPVYNVTVIFVYGFVIFCIFISTLIVRDLPRLPFILKSIALFIIVRSVFVILTHVAPSPYVLVDFADFNFILRRIIFSGDLFFSGHTGLPFLMALLYWEKKYLRYLFIAISIIFGFTVLLGHLHYSIDVLAAFFITYGIYRLAQIFFKKDFTLFNLAGEANK